MESKVRNRSAKITKDSIFHNNESIKFSSDDFVRNNKISLIYWIILIVLFLSTSLYIQQLNHKFPTPVDRSTKGFSEYRAKDYLSGLIKFGFRPVGSEANEIQAVNYLLKELHSIKKKTKEVHTIDIDLQQTSGTFSLTFLDYFTSSYDNIQNIVVKLSPSNGATDTLMLNCHYDTVIGSPGVSDDAISCALMLEVIQVISQQDTALVHNIVFLFNGAEENILQGSHGFITNHPWASDIRAFVNLDSAGAGGRELLFQAGPGHPWLVAAYAESAPHPFASVIGHELFGSGIIPSDTDYRVFRDYGALPGLDIAYITNGYVYHTPYDTMDRIPAGCMQRGGDNLLALVRNLAVSPKLKDPGTYRHGNLVFMDLFGWCMVVYPARIGFILNSFVVLVVVLRMVTRKKGGASVHYIQRVCEAAACCVFSWIVSLVAIIAMALLVDKLGYALSWYSNTWLISTLYLAPAAVIVLAMHNYFKEVLFKDEADPWDVESAFYDAHQMILSLFIAFLTAQEIASSVLLLWWILLPLIVRDGFSLVFGINAKANPVLHCFLHLVSVLPPTALFMHSIYQILLLFIPIMGRAGASVVPDAVIATFALLAFILCIGHHFGMIYLSDVRPLIKLFGVIFAVSCMLVLVTPIGFPYKADPAQPTKQRHIINHLDRTFHDISGHITKYDSGLLHLPLDRHGLTMLRPYMPRLQNSQVADCQGVYCGWPFYLPLMSKLSEYYYLSAPRLVVSPLATLTLLNRTQIQPNVERFMFTASGPNHLNVYIETQPGVSLVAWSEGSGVPLPNHNPARNPMTTYFIYYSYGKAPEKPWTFWLDVKVGSGMPTKGSLNIALGAHYLTTDGVNSHTKELSDYLDSFPDWAVPIGWMATYESWVY